MKKIIQYIFPLIAILSLSTSLNAQSNAKNIVTDTLEVSGICGMCEERIENAALIKGVKKVEWDSSTHDLIVVYREDKVSLNDIANSIAEAGHDSELIVCTDEQYDQVHSCCKYREQDSH